MKLKEQGLQFIKFGLVGVLNTLVDFLVYQLLVYLGLHYAPAQCISYTWRAVEQLLFQQPVDLWERKTIYQAGICCLCGGKSGILKYISPAIAALLRYPGH